MPGKRDRAKTQDSKRSSKRSRSDASRHKDGGSDFRPVKRMNQAWKGKAWADCSLSIPSHIYDQMREKKMCTFYNLMCCHYGSKCHDAHRIAQEWSSYVGQQKNASAANSAFADELKEITRYSGGYVILKDFQFDSAAEAAKAQPTQEKKTAEQCADEYVERNFPPEELDNKDEEGQEEKTVPLNLPIESKIREASDKVKEIAGRLSTDTGGLMDGVMEELQAAQRELAELRKEKAHQELHYAEQAERARVMETSTRHERGEYIEQKKMAWYKHRFEVIPPGSLGVWDPDNPDPVKRRPTIDKTGVIMDQATRKLAMKAVEQMLEDLGHNIYCKIATDLHSHDEVLAKMWAMNAPSNRDEKYEAAKHGPRWRYWQRASFKCNACHMPMYAAQARPVPCWRCLGVMYCSLRCCEHDEQHYYCCTLHPGWMLRRERQHMEDEQKSADEVIALSLSLDKSCDLATNAAGNSSKESAPANTGSSSSSSGSGSQPANQPGSGFANRANRPTSKEVEEAAVAEANREFDESLRK